MPMDAHFVAAGRSFPLLYADPNMKSEPILGVVDGRWFPLPFSVSSFVVPLSHEMHVRTEHIASVVPAGTTCSDVNSSLMYDRAWEWKWIKAMPLMTYDEYRMRVECAGQQRSGTCAEVAAKLSDGSGADKRLAASTIQVNRQVDVAPILISIAVILAVGAIVYWIWIKKDGRSPESPGKI